MKYKLIKKYPNSPELGFISDKTMYFPQDYPEFWEECVELNVPIGTKFKHKGYDSLVYTIRGIKDDNALIEWKTGKEDFFTIKQVNQYFKDGTWIEYKEKEKEYEILSGVFRYDVNIFSYSEDKLLKSLVPHIKSVKRLFDGEVFTIGDNIQHNTAEDKGKILSIHLKEDGYIYFSTSYCKSEMGTRYDNCKKIKPLFKTEDGKEMFEGDNIYYIDNWKIIESKIPASQYNSMYAGAFKRFSTKKAAQNYIENHKPCLSFNDV